MAPPDEDALALVLQHAARRDLPALPLSDVWGLIAVEALIGLIYGAGGYALIRAMEVVGRRHATLERA